MTKASPEIEALAAERLGRDEERITGSSRRRSFTLADAWREFWRHPSPWMLVVALAAALVARVTLGGWSWWELLVPIGLAASFPFIEWVVHVCILHWRPRKVGPVTLDAMVARKHREHHADPRDIPLVFIPWQVMAWLIPSFVLAAWVAAPDWGWATTALVGAYGIGFGYEWTHYLVHSDYKPRSRVYRSMWRNHRLHHYKNEHYWFTVTTSGTSDRLFGTCPDPATVPSSKTVKSLHATEGV